MGLRMFIAVGRAIVEKGGRLVLLNPQSAVNEVLTVAGLGRIIPVVFDEQEARRLIG